MAKPVFAVDRPLVVIDCETTGLGRVDRVIEIAALTLDPQSGETIDEYDTLINPQRGVGPTRIHGITSAMVEAAPVFSEVIAALAARLSRCIVVAHNISFDQRMIGDEFARLGVPIDWGRGICTYQLSGLNLGDACDHYGITLDNHHRALADARAAAELVRVFAKDIGRSYRSASVGHVPYRLNARTLQRPEPTRRRRRQVRPAARRTTRPESGRDSDLAASLAWMIEEYGMEEHVQPMLDDLIALAKLPRKPVDAAHIQFLLTLAASEPDWWREDNAEL